MDENEIDLNTGMPLWATKMWAEIKKDLEEIKESISKV